MNLSTGLSVAHGSLALLHISWKCVCVHNSIVLLQVVSKLTKQSEFNANYGEPVWELFDVNEGDYRRHISTPLDLKTVQQRIKRGGFRGNISKPCSSASREVGSGATSENHAVAIKRGGFRGKSGGSGHLGDQSMEGAEGVVLDGGL